MTPSWLRAGWFWLTFHLPLDRGAFRFDDGADIASM